MNELNFCHNCSKQEKTDLPNLTQNINVNPTRVDFSGFPPGTNRRTVQQTFKKFGKFSKLFLYPDGTFGSIYFHNRESAERAYSTLNFKPPLKLKLLINKNECRCKSENSFVTGQLKENKGSSFDTSKGSSETDVSDAEMFQQDITNLKLNDKVFVDIHGKEVKTCIDKNNCVYVSLEELWKVGIFIHEKNKFPCKVDFNKAVENHFESFIMIKAYEYMIENNYYPDDKQSLLNKSISNVKEHILNINSENEYEEFERSKSNNAFLLNGETYKPLLKPYFIYQEMKSRSSLGEKQDFQENEIKKQSHQKCGKKLKAENRIKLELGSTIKAIVTFVENEKFCYINVESNLNLIQSVGAKIQDEGDNAETIRNPSIGELCLALYEGLWYRAEILTTKPLRVRYIDYGNVNNVSLKEVKKLNTLNMIEAQAVRVRFENTPKTLTEDEELTLKVISMESDGTYLVEIYDPNYQTLKKNEIKEVNVNSSQRERNLRKEINSILSQKNKFQIRSILEYETTRAVFDCVQEYGEDNFVAFCVPEQLTQEFESLEKIPIQTFKELSFKPAIGDYISLLHSEDGMVRGQIVNLKEDTYIVALIDYGDIKEVEDVYPLGEEFFSIPQFTIMCRGSKDDIQLIKKFQDNTAYWSKESNHIFIENKSGKIKLNAEKWEPVASTEVIYTTPFLKKGLANGDQIKISHETNGILYVRTKECHNIFKEICAYIQNYEVLPLSNKPVKGQLVMSPFRISSDYYRATIKTVLNNKMVIVNYPDYGNELTVNIKALRSIDKKLASLPATLIDVSLEGFVNKPFDPKQAALISDFIKNKDIFITKLTTTPSVVSLITKGGQTLTEILLGTHQNNYLTKEDLIETKINNGSYEVLCLYVDKKESFASFILKNTESIIELSSTITDYINAKDAVTPYCPKIDEVCLVMQDSEWYRAYVTNVISANKFEVFFIDYGNKSIVTSKEIKKISEELVKIPCYAVFCTTKGINMDLNEYESYSIKIIGKEEGLFKIEKPIEM